MNLLSMLSNADREPLHSHPCSFRGRSSSHPCSVPGLFERPVRPPVARFGCSCPRVAARVGCSCPRVAARFGCSCPPARRRPRVRCQSLRCRGCRSSWKMRLGGGVGAGRQTRFPPQAHFQSVNSGHGGVGVGGVTSEAAGTRIWVVRPSWRECDPSESLLRACEGSGRGLIPRAVIAVCQDG